jgi:hypothetical protein
MFLFFYVANFSFNFCQKSHEMEMKKKKQAYLWCVKWTLTISGRSTHICALEGKVEVAKVHIFMQSGI